MTGSIIIRLIGWLSMSLQMLVLLVVRLAIPWIPRGQIAK
jgi:hypothetical protein